MALPGLPSKEVLSASFSGPKTDPFMGAKKKSASMKVGLKKVRASFTAAKEVVTTSCPSSIDIGAEGL